MAAAFGHCSILGVGAACSSCGLNVPSRNGSSRSGSGSIRSSRPSSTAACNSSSAVASTPPRFVCFSSPTTPSPSTPSSREHFLSALLSRMATTSMSCQAAPEKAPTTNKTTSLLCPDCEGNGAVVCSQCDGEGLNPEDRFGGKFKAGTICWLCRGKKQMLCGNCNGAGFLGGFLNTQDD